MRIKKLRNISFQIYVVFQISLNLRNETLNYVLLKNCEPE